MAIFKTAEKILIILLNLFLFPSLFGKEINIEFSDELPPCPADYLTDCLLASNGTIWVTSEGNGIYRLDPSKKTRVSKESWFDVSYYDQGLPKNTNYSAIAEDKQGRIWVGTENKGVIVFNGEKWKTYDRENALLGEHIFDIAVSSLTGDIAVATSGGVNIYSPRTGHWIDLTRAEGLIEDQVETLAYDGKGSLWLGYACGGVSQLAEKENYRIVKTDQAKWYWDNNNHVRQPMDGSGSGLPSNLCNAVLPIKNGTILLGTNSGLAVKKGKNDWKYIRGKDFYDKNKGLWDVKVDRNISSKALSFLLPEDYITCFTETHEGCWIGFRQKGAVLINPQTLKILKAGKFPENIKTPFIKSLLPLPSGSIYAITYGHGLVKIYESGKRNKLRVVQQNQFPQHPSLPYVKTLEELESEVETLEKKAHDFRKNQRERELPVMAWKEDWATQGNWCGRYGISHTLLCATHYLSDDEIYCAPKKIEITRYIGWHKRNDDLISFRSLGDDDSENVNVLFNPKTGTRVATEWTDNGEKYGTTFDGSDIWIEINIPDGIYELALYFYNYNGKDLNIGALRDYQIEIRKENPSSNRNNLKFDKKSSQLLSMPILARQRVKDFAGSGVYKTFILKKSGHYYIRILNNYSTDTILNGIFISKLSNGRKICNEQIMPAIYAGIIPRPIEIIDKKSSVFEKMRILREKIYSFATSYHYLFYENRLKLIQLRLMQLDHYCENFYDSYLWDLNIVNRKKQEEFEQIMTNSWHKNQDENIICRSQEFYPFSPRTIPFSLRECEIMEYMNIDWMQYLPSSTSKPEIGITELKEKISSLSPSNISKLENNYKKRKMEEYINKIHN